MSADNHTRSLRPTVADTWVLVVDGEPQWGWFVRKGSRPRLNDRPGREEFFQAEHANGFRPIAARDLDHAARMLYNGWAKEQS